MELMELLATRRTFRRFQQTPIPSTVVSDIINALRLSSSGANRQGIRILIIEKPEDIRTVHSHVKWAAALPPELGTPKEDELPTLFVAVLEDTNVANELNVDAGIALANMTLAAWAHGVGHCIMGAIDRPALTTFFKLPSHLRLHTMIAFGYPDHKSTVVALKNEDKKYYLDKNHDYFVPKYSAEELSRYL